MHVHNYSASRLWIVVISQLKCICISKTVGLADFNLKTFQCALDPLQRIFNYTGNPQNMEFCLLDLISGSVTIMDLSTF